MPILRKLKLTLKTGGMAYAGTDASIYLLLCLGTGSRTYLLPSRAGDLQTGRLDTYRFALADGPQLQDLVGIVLVNGMDGTSAGWNLEWVRIEAVDEDGRAWGLVEAQLDRWLDTKDRLGPAAALPLQRPWLELGDQDVVGEPAQRLTSLEAKPRGEEDGAR